MMTRKKARLLQMGLALIVLLTIAVLIVFRWYFNTFPYVTGMGEISAVRITDGTNTLVWVDDTTPEGKADLQKLTRSMPRWRWGAGVASAHGHSHNQSQALAVVLLDTEGDIAQLLLPQDGEIVTLPAHVVELHPRGNEWRAPEFLGVLGEIGLKNLPEEIPLDVRQEPEKLLRKWYSTYGD
jgi:hypothetical protein